MTALPHPAVLVTGVSSGIDRATTALPAASRYRVYGNLRAIKPETDLAGVTLVRFDIRDGNSIQTAVQSNLQREQRIDAVVKCRDVAFWPIATCRCTE
jgi:NADP-dependent 3-hydroxy acid dehydrogenase YdfG